jgi:hypothetical protein
MMREFNCRLTMHHWVMLLAARWSMTLKYMPHDRIQ